MDLDTKQKVLMAIYTEYQKDIPEMHKAIVPDNIGIDRASLYMALVKLQNEGYISDIDVTYGGSSRVPVYVIIDTMLITRDGIQYVEQKLDISGTLSGKEKAEVVKKNFVDQGLDVLTDFAAKVTAEIIKSQTGQQ